MPCPKRKTVNWLDKLRFIAHYATDGCSTTLKIYVETAWAAETNLVLAIINTSPKDFVRFLLRPKGARTARHGIRSLGRNEAAAEEETIPDTAKLAADTLADAVGLHVPTWGHLGDALYEVAKPIEQAAYYLILINATEDFAFDWYSGILLSPGSKCSIGRFGYAAFLGPQQSYATQLVPVAGAIITPIDAFEDEGGIRIGGGTWCVIITVGVEQYEFGRPTTQWRYHMVLDFMARAQCGDSEEIELKQGELGATKKVVRKVTGPDWIGIVASMHVDPETSFGGAFTVNIEAFRI